MLSNFFFSFLVTSRDHSSSEMRTITEAVEGVFECVAATTCEMLRVVLQVKCLVFSVSWVLLFSLSTTQSPLKPKEKKKEQQKSNRNQQSTINVYCARYREVVTEHKLRIVNLLHNTNCVLAPLTNDVQRDVV